MRYHRFMLRQQDISAQKLRRRIGQKLTVLVESASDRGYSGRSYADAPGIDGLVHIETMQELKQGEFHDVIVNGADEYDLYASPDVETLPIGQQTNPAILDPDRQ